MYYFLILIFKSLRIKKKKKKPTDFDANKLFTILQCCRFRHSLNKNRRIH